MRINVPDMTNMSFKLIAEIKKSRDSNYFMK